MDTKENGLDNTQPQTRAPSRGGWAKAERADMNLAIRDKAPDLHRKHDADQPYQHDKRSGHEEDDDVFHGSGPVKDEVAEAPEGEPKALATYLRQWSELYRGHQEGIGPCGFEEGVPHLERHRLSGVVDSGFDRALLAQGNVHEGAGFLGADSRLWHGLPLSEKSDATNGTAPMPKDGSAGQNESPEAVSEGNDGR